MSQWPTVRLVDVATIERHSIQSRDISDGETYVGLDNITGEGGFVGVRTVDSGDLKSSKFEFSPEHLLYGKLRPYLAKIAAPDFAGICSTDILPIRPTAAIDRRYLLHYLRTPRMVKDAAALAVGVNLPRLSPKTLEAFAIPLPPIEEQRRIAAVLDAVDALRTKRRQALAKLDTLTQAIFTEMFLTSERDQWATAPIEELAATKKGSIRTGPFGSQLLHEEFTDEGIAVLGIDNAVQNRFAWGERRYISNGKYEALKRYTVFPGDVLVTIMGTCGRVAVIPEDIPAAINTKHLCSITLDHNQCLPDYLWGCMSYHPDVRRQLGETRGAVMPGLNMGIIKRTEIPVPPLRLQQSFVEAKLSVESRVTQLEESMARLDTLFASIQQQAFRGEL